jgi:hypothetical protein
MLLQMGDNQQNPFHDDTAGRLFNRALDAEFVARESWWQGIKQWTTSVPGWRRKALRGQNRPESSATSRYGAPHHARQPEPRLISAMTDIVLNESLTGKQIQSPIAPSRRRSSCDISQSTIVLR